MKAVCSPGEILSDEVMDDSASVALLRTCQKEERLHVIADLIDRQIENRRRASTSNEPDRHLAVKGKEWRL
jgi:hypothetical protein